MYPAAKQSVCKMQYQNTEKYTNFLQIFNVSDFLDFFQVLIYLSGLIPLYIAFYSRGSLKNSNPEAFHFDAQATKPSPYLLHNLVSGGDGK